MDAAKESLALSADGLAVEIIDQTKLPRKLEVIRLSEPTEFFEAIHKLKVRGAPAIGVCAALAISVFAKRALKKDPAISSLTLANYLTEQALYLESSRPTAVNLDWALSQMLDCIKTASHLSAPKLQETLQRRALEIYEDDISRCRKIAEAGFPLIKESMGILTHCNAGRLATVKYGTALAPIYLAHERGISLKVYADETRPLLQGARLTAFELTQAGIDTMVLCDSMSSILMSEGNIDMVIVGADRIAANGDSANKVGSSNLAIVANYYKVPFYVAAPASTIDLSARSGKEIPIEMRDQEEVRSMWYKEPMIDTRAQIFNPAFDVIDASLITGFILDSGLITQDFKEGLAHAKR